MRRRFIIGAGVVALFIIVSIALPEGAVARSLRFSTPVFIGFHGGDDWEPDIAADQEGHVYVAWAHYGGVPGCDTCSSLAAMIEISKDGGRTWSAEVQVSRFIRGFNYKTQEGYNFTYGDYYGMAWDGSHVHIAWGEGPDYIGPGNVWYATSN